MEERYIEIRFYYYLLKLLAKFKYSIHVLDVIEAYCALGDIDTRVIKNLLRQVKENCGIINTYKEEAQYKVVTYYRSRTRQYIEGKVDVKWSRSQNVKN